MKDNVRLDDASAKLESLSRDEKLAGIRKILIGNQLEDYEKRIESMLEQSKKDNHKLYELVDTLIHEFYDLQGKVAMQSETQPKGGVTSAGPSHDRQDQKNTAELQGLIEEALNKQSTSGQTAERETLVQALLQELIPVVENSESKQRDSNKKIEQWIELNEKELQLLGSELSDTRKLLRQNQEQVDKKIGRLDSLLREDSLQDYEDRISALEKKYAEFKNLGSDAFEAKIKSHKQELEQDFEAHKSELQSWQSESQLEFRELIELISARVSEQLKAQQEQISQIKAELAGWENGNDIDERLSKIEHFLGGEISSVLEKIVARQNKIEDSRHDDPRIEQMGAKIELLDHELSEVHGILNNNVTSLLEQIKGQQKSQAEKLAQYKEELELQRKNSGNSTAANDRLSQNQGANPRSDYQQTLKRLNRLLEREG